MDGFVVVLVVDVLLLACFLEPMLLPGRLRRVWVWIGGLLGRGGKGKGVGVDVEVGDGEGEGGEGVSGNRGEGNLQRFVASVAKCVGTGETGLVFGWDGLSLVLTSRKTILAPQSGSVGKGKMWAVMGGSGAGKSE